MPPNDLNQQPQQPTVDAEQEIASQFEHEGVSCRFTNTVADSIAGEVIRAALGVPEAPHVNAKGEVDEDKFTAFHRTFADCAAYSRDVKGVPGWVELDMYSKVDAIKAAAKYFLSGAVYPGTIVFWQAGIQKFLYGIDTLGLSMQGLQAVQEGGAAAVNFTASGESAPADGSATSPPPKKESTRRTPTLATSIPAAGNGGKKPTGKTGSGRSRPKGQPS